MNESKLSRAAELEEEAARLRNEAFAERLLPDFWRVGQKVRMLHYNEWAWRKGSVLTIVDIDRPGTPAAEYQVFWTAPPPPSTSIYWTTPNDVELVEDVCP